QPVFRQRSAGSYEVNGLGGIGIPAMSLAVEKGCELAGDAGISAIAIRDAGHTGRLGAFAEGAADNGYLVMILGGGNRKTWRQVAPYGGRQPMLPTNPYCIGIPGGDRGPVILDFATSQIAGGWIYAAKSAGGRLPEGSVINRQGQPTTDPDEFFEGGAILPAGGPKGYALALVAELVGEAMLGPAITECNWLMITINTVRYRDTSKMQTIAEEILSELRNSPPASGFDQVEIPGERERQHKNNSCGVINVPTPTWDEILKLQR
ncbi:MAG: Ldh family oxidoreductase, partial [Granulosicoccus sp.]|nr:Ldh family oxidoreductase [Granulosicoccus sp.]